MQETVNRQYPYPELVGDGANVPYWLQRALEAVDGDVDTLDLILRTVEDIANKAARGLVSEVREDVDSIGLGGSSVMMNRTAVQLKAGRRYRFRYQLSIRSNQIANQIIGQIKTSPVADTGATGTIKKTMVFFTPPIANTWGGLAPIECSYIPAVDEVVSVKAVFARGSGTAVWDATGRTLTVHDEGAV